MDAWPIIASLRVRDKLLLFILLLYLPASGIIIASGLSHRESKIREAMNKSLLLVQSLAAQQEQIAAGTEEMLSTLAQLPEVRGLNPKACNELFRRLQDRHPFYSVIALATPAGNLVASSAPIEPDSVNLADQKHFKAAAETLILLLRLHIKAILPPRNYDIRATLELAEDILKRNHSSNLSLRKKRMAKS